MPQAKSTLEALVYNDPSHPKFLEYFSRILWVIQDNKAMGKYRCPKLDEATLCCVESLLEQMEKALKG